MGQKTGCRLPAGAAPGKYRKVGIERSESAITMADCPSCPFVM